MRGRTQDSSYLRWARLSYFGVDMAVIDALDLDPCVRSIVCGLSSAARSALIAALQADIAGLDAQILLLQEKALRYDLLATAAQVTVTALEAVLAQLKAGLSIIPTALIAGCVDLGDTMVAASEYIDRTTAELETTLRDRVAVISFADELKLLIAKYQKYRDLFQAIIDTVNLC